MAANPFFIESFRGYVPKLAQNFASYSGPGNLMENGSALGPSSLQGLLAEYLSATVSNNQHVGAIINGLAASETCSLYMKGGTGGSWQLRHSMLGNYARTRVGFSHMTNLVGNGGIQFLDAGTVQWSFFVDTSGRVNICRGAIGGTTLYQSTAVVLANIRHYFVIDVTTDNTTGTLDIWMDGSAMSGGSLTGLDTCSNSNEYVNQWEFSVNGAGSAHGFASFFIQDNTDAAATITGDRVVDGLLVEADDAVQFSPALSVVGRYHSQQSATTNAPGAGQLALVPVTPEVNMTINSVYLMPRATSAGAKFKGVIYSDNAGAPDSLLSSGTEATGCTTGVSLSLALVTPQALTGGTQYWIGYITDTSVVLNVADPYNSVGQKKANTYASGAPAGPLSGMTTGQSTWAIWGSATGSGSNYDQVNDLCPNIVASLPIGYNQSATVGHVDSFTVEDLPVTPTSIDMVQVKVLAMRSDAGARTINIKAKSGATAGNGDNAGVTPPTSLQWLSSRFALNPATSAAWTPSEVNGMKAQYEIAS